MLGLGLIQFLLRGRAVSSEGFDAFQCCISQCSLGLLSLELGFLHRNIERHQFGARFDHAIAGVVHDLVEAPAHHYTRGLLGSVLSLESAAERMTQIKGVVPSPADFPAGCRFADRCPLATETCRTTPPGPVGTPTHTAACHHPAIDLVTSEVVT